jgi:hypothetical protein
MRRLLSLWENGLLLNAFYPTQGEDAFSSYLQYSDQNRISAQKKSEETEEMDTHPHENRIAARKGRNARLLGVQS